jgi:pyridoxamine 5'-phosphate oxidase
MVFDTAVDPMTRFLEWFEEAKRANIPLADAMALATATRAGRPSLRWVLFKGVSNGGISFYTNYESRKSRELAENPWAAASFHWEPLQYQVRFEGCVEKVSTQESDSYWATRPRASQLSAATSPQSQVIKNYSDLEARVSDLEKKLHGRDVPRPENWGGFCLIPQSIEFWIGKHHRLHERVRFERDGTSWQTVRLAP